MPARPAGGVLRPRRAQGGAGRGRRAANALSRRHLPAGLQGASRGRAPPRGRPRDRADRPRRPSRGDRHHGPAARRRGAAGRGRGGRRDVPRRAIRPTSPTSPRPRCRWTTPPRSSPRCAAASRRSPGPHKEDICYATTNRQEAVKAMAPRCDVLLVIGAPNSSNSVRLVEVAAAPAPRRPADRSAPPTWTGAGSRRRRGRRHRRRLGAGGAGRARLIAACRERFDVTVEEVSDAERERGFKLPRASWWPDGGLHGSQRQELEAFSPTTTSAARSPSRASPRASRIPTTFADHRARPKTWSRFTKSGWTPRDLPFFSSA